MLIDELLPLIRYFRSHKHAELELSVGVLKNDSFAPGVDFSYFKSLFDALSAAQYWTQSADKHHFATFYFEDSVRGRFNVREAPVFVKKTTLARLDLSCPERKYDVRLSLREELPVPETVDPPTYVRLNERWSFEYKRVWRYDLSKVSSGTTKETACKSAPVYEIELEVCRKETALSDQLLADHILCKAKDLLGRYGSDRTPIPLTLSKHRLWRSKAAIGEL